MLSGVGKTTFVGGPPGPANALSIRNVTTGAPGSQAAAAINGTAPVQTLDLTVPQGPVGPTGPVPWGNITAWVTGLVCVASAPATQVTFGNEAYVCTASHIAGAFAVDLAAGRWLKVAAKGQDGINGVNGTQPWKTQPAAWAASTGYSATAPADCITYQGSSYVCATSHTSGASFDATKWALLAQAGAASAGALQASYNLADVASVPLSRMNLLAAPLDAQSYDAIQLAKLRGVLFPPGGLVDGFLSSTGYDTVNSVNATLQNGQILNQATDANCKYLNHFDGTNGATSSAEATSGHTTTFNGSAKLSTAQSLFGGSSVQITGSSDTVTIASTADFGFGTGDFCFEFWFDPTSNSGTQVLLDTRASSAVGFQLQMIGGVLRYYDWNTGGYITQGTTTLVGGTGFKLRVARKSGVIYQLINGNPDASGACTSNYGTSMPLTLGNQYNGGYSAPGYYDELRISNISRETTTYTPATSAFTVGSSGLLDLRSIPRALLVVPTKAILYARVLKTAGSLNFGSGGNLTGSVSRTGNVADGSAATFTQIDADPVTGVITLRSAPIDLTGQTSAASLRGRLQTNDNALGVAIDGWDIRAVA
ncbi:LamG domain-containing protein [Methylobacterium sp. J-030]|uniref:LamG domain-containing protein n=1 Tax=Methylobacterium sp. J-030 TaxID=2836627 RepID=UPI001FBBEE54|nr:LamG domain-containing protein [Methylobacterium sp. J-030]MCJ2072411.1 LamG domain-containing protein [Methylobacterium sp. J-030]